MVLGYARSAPATLACPCKSVSGPPYLPRPVHRRFLPQVAAWLTPCLCADVTLSEASHTVWIKVPPPAALCCPDPTSMFLLARMHLWLLPVDYLTLKCQFHEIDPSWSEAGTEKYAHTFHTRVHLPVAPNPLPEGDEAGAASWGLQEDKRPGRELTAPRGGLPGTPALDTESSHAKYFQWLNKNARHSFHQRDR